MFNMKQHFALVLSFFSALALAGETAQISQQDLLAAMNKPTNIVVLDVRSKNEYDHGHIAGAINVSHDTVADNISQLEQYKQKTVVVYCRSGRRAAFAENILVENGFSDLRHLTGDMNGWLKAKLPVVNSEHSH